MLGIHRLYDKRFSLQTIYLEKVDSFAQILAWSMADALADYAEAERVSVVALSIRRLRRRKQLQLKYFIVPVHLESSHRMVKRKLTCYWPSNVLEALASLD